jgi:uncharacterized protein YgiM (DUF1202 family)
VLLDPPVSATVKASSLNMRGLPSLSGEVITKLHKGETVTILEEVTLDKARPGEPAKWVRVALPTNTPVWVSAHLVDTNKMTVIPNRLNVRGGPGENFSVVARIDKGTTVKEIRRKDGWIEIEPPVKASAYVAADLLDKQGVTAPSKIEDVQPQNGTPGVETIASGKPAKPVKVTPEVKPIAPETIVKNDPAPLPKVEDTAPVTTTVIEPDIKPTVVPAVDVPVVPIAPTPAPAPETAVTPTAPTNTTVPEVVVPPVAPVTTAPAETMAPALTTAPVLKDEILPKRIVNREGILSKAYNIQAPTYYELHDATTGELLDYLNPSKPELDLKPFIGKKIIVRGEEAMDRRWKFTPVIQVDTLLDAED